MGGKRGLVFGLANDKSLVWGIAKELAAQGTEPAFSYKGPALAKRVTHLSEQLGQDRVFECDAGYHAIGMKQESLRD